MFIIYVSGVFDLFHAGHVTTLKNIKNMSNDVFLIVGVVNDKDATGYKRKPVINETNRYFMLESCKYVDKLIKDAPMFIDKEFIKKYNIDLEVHSFSDKNDIIKQEQYYKIVKELNKFKVIDYSKNDSTSKIIERIKMNF